MFNSLKLLTFSLLFFVISTEAKDSYPPLGLTLHFVTWLNETNYEQFGFTRTDLAGGSFGGKLTENDAITHHPVIFIHGNGDLAAGEDANDQTGFKYARQYFLDQGYNNAELYATTWGFGDVPHEGQHYHTKEYLIYVRKFVEAVIEYTGAPQIDVVSHSMGVTTSRRVLKGGFVYSTPEPFYLGPPLTNKVDTFVGIAGPNWGVSPCSLNIYSYFKTCNNQTGFFPGIGGGKPYPKNLSKYLLELNSDPTKEAQNTFAILSLYDMTVIAYSYDRYASEFPTMDAAYHFDTDNYTHVTVKDFTSEMQYNLVTIHQFFGNDKATEKNLRITQERELNEFLN